MNERKSLNERRRETKGRGNESSHEQNLLGSAQRRTSASLCKVDQESKLLYSSRHRSFDQSPAKSSKNDESDDVSRRIECERCMRGKLEADAYMV